MFPPSAWHPLATGLVSDLQRQDKVKLALPFVSVYDLVVQLNDICVLLNQSTMSHLAILYCAEDSRDSLTCSKF